MTASGAERTGADVRTVVVIGSGPAGYTAAFRAADLGLEVTLVERYESLGGVCLNVGCIPSKALLHAARVIAEVKEAGEFGLNWGEPEIDLPRLDEWKSEVVGRLTGGLAGLAKRRKVEVVTGEARFKSPTSVEVGDRDIAFDACIIAAGSRPVELPGLPEDERIMDSTGALDLAGNARSGGSGGLPVSLLVIGGGIIGLEMACVYDALGTKVSVVELTDTLIPECDRDLVAPLQKRIEARYERIMLGTRVTDMESGEDGIEVSFKGEGAPEKETYEKVLVAVGRRANGDLLNLKASGVKADERGVIAVDERQRTGVPGIYAIGDITGPPMLAHRGSCQGVVAAENIAGEDVTYDAQAVPSVAYTDPEIAWAGLTEAEAKERRTAYEIGKVPWAASGRALATGRSEGMTKVLTEPGTGRILGAGMVGVNAGELIAEVVHAIEMGATASDIALTMHPHPTLSETVRIAAEAAEGVATDIYAPKRQGRAS